MTNELTYPAGRRPSPRPLHQLRLCLLVMAAGLCLHSFIGTAPASADAPGGISGTVRDALSNAPVNDIQVNVYDTSGNVLISVCTLANGTYTITGLPSGTYEVGFESTQGDFKVCGGLTNYLPQFYNSRTTFATATQVTVNTGATTPGIDAAMLPGGAIAGTVTDATSGKPAANIEVDAFDTSGNLTSSTCTAADGTYSVYALARDSYRVEFLNTATCGNPTSYRTQFYSNQSSLAAAQPVAVTISATTPNVNAALVPSDAVTLAVATAGTGAGTVHVAPLGTSCTGSCTYPVLPGSVMTLTAAPASGSTFAGWSGACSGTGVCAVTMSSAESVSASFANGSTSTPPPPPWSHPAPRCSVSVKSARVVLTAPRARKKARKGKAPAVKARTKQVELAYACNQPAQLWLQGSVSFTVGAGRQRSHTKHTRHVKPRVHTVMTSVAKLSGLSGSGTTWITLPPAALKALAGKATVSAVFRLTCVNAHGSGSARARSVRLLVAR